MLPLMSFCVKIFARIDIFNTPGQTRECNLRVKSFCNFIKTINLDMSIMKHDKKSQGLMRIVIIYTLIQCLNNALQ